MRQTIENFFTPAINEVPRIDGRPRLVPKGVDKDSGIRAEYTRASGLAGYVSDSSYLSKWQMRYLARGIGSNPDLAELAAAETYHTGLVPLDIPEKRRSGAALDVIINRALERMKIDEKADYGSAFHLLTEPDNTGIVSERMTPDVASYDDAMTRLAAITCGTEVFVANDTTMTSGTFDHLLRFPGSEEFTGYLIGDKKTGRYDPWHWCIQLAQYAHADPYNVDIHERYPWPGDINKEWGIMMHTPALTGKTHLYAIDLVIGWEMAQIAARVRDFQNSKFDLIDMSNRLPNLIERARICATQGDTIGLRALWSAADPDTRQHIERLVAA